jgi:hypothetical protein
VSVLPSLTDLDGVQKGGLFLLICLRAVQACSSVESEQSTLGDGNDMRTLSHGKINAINLTASFSIIPSVFF